MQNNITQYLNSQVLNKIKELNNYLIQLLQKYRIERLLKKDKIWRKSQKKRRNNVVDSDLSYYIYVRCSYY